MPSKRIVILDVTGNVRVRYALRADVPAGQEAAYANAIYTSIYGDGADPDLAAIRAGSVAEMVTTADFDPIGGETAVQLRNRVQAALQDVQAAYQALITALTPRRFFGRFWDGVTWANLP